jgi:hypothetical protein
MHLHVGDVGFRNDAEHRVGLELLDALPLGAALARLRAVVERQHRLRRRTHDEVRSRPQSRTAS